MEQTFFAPCHPFAQGAILFSMPSKDQVRTQVGMSMLTSFTVSAGDGGVDRHALPVFGHPCKLMSQHKRMLEFRVTDRSFRKPMQIRTANAHRFDTNKLFPLTSHRDLFLM